MILRPPLRLVLAGAGHIARAYELAVRGMDDADIVGVVDVAPEAAMSLAALAGCPSYSTLDGALGSCDAVIVCTPPATHAGLSARSVAGGIPVLCEKPLSTAFEPARQMLETAERAGVLLALASKFRFVDDLARAREMLASGLVGVPVVFELSFTSRVEMAARWNADPRVSGGGVIIDNGSHAVDLVRYLFGPVTEVTAMEAARVQGLPVEETVQLLVRTSSGATGHIQLSWSLDQRLENYLSVYGTSGAILVGWRRSRYRKGSTADWVSFGRGYDKVEAIRRQTERFCVSVRDGEPFPVTTADALASMEVVDAAYTSLHGAKRVRTGVPTTVEASGQG